MPTAVVQMVAMHCAAPGDEAAPAAPRKVTEATKPLAPAVSPATLGTGSDLADPTMRLLVGSLPLLLALLASLAIAGFLAFQGVRSVARALAHTGLGTAEAGAPGWQGQVAMRRNWGGFGLENSGWMLSPSLTQLLTGVAMTGLSVLVLWQALSIVRERPSAVTQPQPTSPAPAQAPQKSALPAAAQGG